MSDPRGLPMFKSPGRLEAFSDGVFAIAVTLLILEIKVPPVHDIESGRALWAALAERWPSFFAFALSFFTILVAWVGHHLMVQHVKRVTWRLVFTNGLFLLTITFLPFPTALVAEHLGHAGGGAAAAFYALANGLNSLAFLFVHLAVRAAAPEALGEFLVGLNKSVLGLVLCLAAAVLAAWSPIASLIGVALVWVWWAVPGLLPPAAPRPS